MRCREVRWKTATAVPVPAPTLRATRWENEQHQLRRYGGGESVLLHLVDRAQGPGGDRHGRDLRQRVVHSRLCSRNGDIAGQNVTATARVLTCAAAALTVDRIAPRRWTPAARIPARVSRPQARRRRPHRPHADVPIQVAAVGYSLTSTAADSSEFADQTRPQRSGVLAEQPDRQP